MRSMALSSTTLNLTPSVSIVTYPKVEANHANSALPSSWSPPSSKASRYVILGTPVARRGEDPACTIELDELAQIHEGGEHRDTRGLLHIVSDDNDGVILLELVDELFDLGGRDRIEG